MVSAQKSLRSLHEGKRNILAVYIYAGIISRICKGFHISSASLPVGAFNNLLGRSSSLIASC